MTQVLERFKSSWLLSTLVVAVSLYGQQPPEPKFPRTPPVQPLPFSHKLHTDAGAKCETCHGPVAERDVLKKEVETNMGSCMSCHQKNKASNDCGTCHEKLN